MKGRPKLLIKKKVVLNKDGYFRYYSPLYKSRKQKGKSIMISLDPNDTMTGTGRYCPFVDIRTEKQLVIFLKDSFGYGEFLIFAFCKGHNGFWVFWKGEINEDGWLFRQKEYNKKEVKSLESELNMAEDSDEKLEIERDLDEAKQEAKEESKYRRYGFAPFLAQSGIRGSFHMWDEPDEALVEKPKQIKRTKNVDEMTIDEINEV